jgi:hypothetical protein
MELGGIGCETFIKHRGALTEYRMPSVRVANDKKLLSDAARVRENKIWVALIVATSYQAV